jgi:HEAT repeat protein
MATASSLVLRLQTVGSDLPSSLAAQIVSLGSETIPLLLRVLDERPVAEQNGEPSTAEGCSDCGQQHNDRGWARLHAVDLLTDLREPTAVDTMLKVLASSRSDEPLHDKIVERLPDFGLTALEPTLAALARTAKDAETFESLCCILSVLGVRDERILQALLELLKAQPRAAAMYLSDYGDPAACPAMLAVIASSKANIDNSFERMELFDLLDAYASLGGNLPPDVKARIDAWLGD